MNGKKHLQLSMATQRSASNFAFSPSTAKVSILFLALVIISLFSASSGVSIEGTGEVVEPIPQQDSLPSSTGGAASPSRVKRSRDVQQLCGYRLLDALRSVCDRNFVGFTRRSDPTLFIQSNEGQSGEELGSLAPYSGALNGLNLSPWEILTFELPQSSAGSQVGDDNPVVSNSNNLDASMLDYLELLQQQVSSNPFATPSWTSYSGRGTGNSSGNKAFALKMLAEPPKTHQRFRRNIIDECCKKPCAMNQMLKYCAITAVGKRSY